MNDRINEYFAHSENDKNIRQTMLEHSIGVGKIMRNFALSDQYSDIYEFCGQIHDMGK